MFFLPKQPAAGSPDYLTSSLPFRKLTRSLCMEYHSALTHHATATMSATSSPKMATSSLTLQHYNVPNFSLFATTLPPRAKLTAPWLYTLRRPRPQTIVSLTMLHTRVGCYRRSSSPTGHRSAITATVLATSHGHAKPRWHVAVVLGHMQHVTADAPLSLCVRPPLPPLANMSS